MKQHGDRTGPYGTIRDLTGPYRTILEHTGPYWNLRELTGPYGTIQDLTGPHWTIHDHDHTRPYRTIRDRYVFKSLQVNGVSNFFGTHRLTHRFDF